MGLGESNSQMVSLTDELSQKNEELLRHQEEIAQLLSQIVELQHRVKEVGWLNWCCIEGVSNMNLMCYGEKLMVQTWLTWP